MTDFDTKAAVEQATADVPNINVTNAAEAADGRAELGRAELSGLFLREDLLVDTPRIGKDGYIDPEKLGLKDAGPAQVRPISTAEVKALVESRYHVWRWQGPEARGKRHTAVPMGFRQPRAATPPTSEKLPRTYDGFTESLTRRRSGQTERSSTRLDTTTNWTPLHARARPRDSAYHGRPDRRRTVKAVLLIEKPIAEFPFVTDDDRATCIGSASTPNSRHRPAALTSSG